MAIKLCGGLEVTVAGRRVELPGRQARLLFGLLMVRRGQPVERQDLIEALWEEERPPADPRAALNVILARLRGALGREIVSGRSHLALALPPHTEVDVDTALAAGEAAREALAAGRPAAVIEAGLAAIAVLERPLLPEFGGEWREERQRELDDHHADALALVAEAGLAIGRPQLHAAERAARALIAREPYAEAGHVLLMRCQAAAGNAAEALRTYETLRRVLDEELGALPGPAARALHESLLRAGAAGAPELSLDGAADTPRVPLPAALRPRGGGSLYGREPELERLRAWRLGGHGVGLCVLGGDAGIGKTRLAGELAREAHAGGAEVLYGRCDSDSTLPYQPFIEALRHRLAHLLPALDAGLAAELGELSRLVPELRAAGYVPAQATPEDPALRRRQVFDAVGAILSAAAQAGGGLLLVLDDLQWADPETAGLLRHVLRLDVAGRLAILAVHRHPELSAEHPIAAVFAEGRRQGFREHIVLAGLHVDAVSRLTAALAPQGGSPRFLQALHAGTGGNPLFVEELLLELTASGRLEGRPIQVSDLDDVGVPETVQIVVARRLSRLGPEVAAVLREAAVVGPRFRLAVLEELGPGRDPLPAVETAQRAGLLVEQGDEDSLAFPHEIVRQAIYCSQSAARRVRVHGEVARVLARRPELGGGAAELARHWTAAHEAEPARAASLQAARQAAELAAFADALRHYEAALRFWPPSPETVREERRDVLEDAADAARWAGDPGRAAELVREALALAGDPADPRRGRLHDRLARYLWEQGDFQGSLREYEDASHLPEDPPPSVEAARMLGGQALACMFQERFDRCRDRARRALEMARAVGARREEGHALNTLGVALGMTGRPDEGVAALREALAIAEELEHLEDRCRSYVNLSELLVRAGRTAQAAGVALDGFRFTRARGLVRSGTPIVAANAVVALSRLGRWDEACALAAETLASEPPEGASAFLRIAYAHLLVLRGEPEAARVQLADAEPAVAAAYEPELTVDLAVAQAELALFEARPRQARATIERALGALAPGAQNDLALRLLAMAMRTVPEPDAPEDRAWRAEAAERAAQVAGELERRGAMLAVARALAATIAAERDALAGEPEASARWAAVRMQWQALEDVPAAARAELAEAAALLAEGDAEAARAGVEHVVASARRIGARALEQEAARVAARLPAR